MKRRAFLKAGVLGGVALAAAGAAPLWLGSRGARATGPGGFVVFSPDEAGILSVLAARLVAPLDAAELQVARRIDGLLAGSDPLTQRDLKQLLRLFGGRIGALFEGRWSAFADRSIADQNATLAKWRDSRLALRRSGFQALQRLCLAVAYANPVTYRDIGYPGPPDVQRPDGATDVWNTKP